jgi:pectin methylesterase-like acyl-CoA thioesterase
MPEQTAATVFAQARALRSLIRNAAQLFVLALFGLDTTAAVGATLLVPEDFPTIQAAVDAAAADDAVLVAPGTYTENVTLRANIEVRGSETARTLLAPDDTAAASVAIGHLSGARFGNFTLIEASTGIAITASSNVEIANKRNHVAGSAKGPLVWDTFAPSRFCCQIVALYH